MAKRKSTVNKAGNYTKPELRKRYKEKKHPMFKALLLESGLQKGVDIS